jgi:two-component system phosphate regulon sensor histidine kinase PhoR
LAFKNKAKRKNINIRFERSTEINVKADIQAVERILNNLLDNAFKYSPDDSEVEIKIRKQGEFVKISVLDSGEGVSDEDQRLVFKRFYRTARARAHTQQGSGLGLAIVRNLVNNLQGEVGVDSRQGDGSEFWFTLPAS